MKRRRPPQGFVDIPGYEGRYAISRNGRIFSSPNKKRKHSMILRNTIRNSAMKRSVYQILKAA